MLAGSGWSSAGTVRPRPVVSRMFMEAQRSVDFSMAEASWAGRTGPATARWAASPDSVRAAAGSLRL